MTAEQPTAAELGLMAGFPPPPELRVTHERQLRAPYNRWSFQHELQLNRTADSWRGAGPVAPLERDPRDLSAITYQNHAGETLTFDDMVERSYTDGILVLHRGAIIYERYLNGMQRHTLHAWASCSKAVTGTLAAMLAHEGRLDPEALITAYLPELAGSGFAGATVRQAMDMTAGIDLVENDPDPQSDGWRYSVAMGWVAAPPDHTGPASSYEVLPTLRRECGHGLRFRYLTPNTDALAWIIKRVLGMPLAAALEERIWSKLGAERDAFWIVDPAGAETAGSGLITTLPDMARFGQMLLDQGRANGQQIVPAAVVADIAGGGDPAAFARGPAASPATRGYSFRHQWWVTHNAHGAYQTLGYGGQMLYIDPAARLVVAKMSSYPTPTPAGNEFYSAFAAFPALARALAE